VKVDFKPVDRLAECFLYPSQLDIPESSKRIIKVARSIIDCLTLGLLHGLAFAWYKFRKIKQKKSMTNLLDIEIDIQLPNPNPPQINNSTDQEKSLTIQSLNTEKKLVRIENSSRILMEKIYKLYRELNLYPGNNSFKILLKEIEKLLENHKISLETTIPAKSSRYPGEEFAKKFLFVSKKAEFIDLDQLLKNEEAYFEIFQLENENEFFLLRYAFMNYALKSKNFDFKHLKDSHIKYLSLIVYKKLPDYLVDISMEKTLNEEQLVQKLTQILNKKFQEEGRSLKEILGHIEVQELFESNNYLKPVLDFLRKS
jgi:hypothetical protein